MRCSEFLTHYSDFRDGRLRHEALHWQMDQHLERCRRCSAYHARIARGTLLLRAASDIEPSPQFRRALRRRLATPYPQPDPVVPAGARVMAGLMLVAAIGFVIAEATGGPARIHARRPASEGRVEVVLPVVQANAGVPFVSFTELSIAAPAFLPTTDTVADPRSGFVSHTAIAR